MATTNITKATQSIPGLFTMDINSIPPVSTKILQQNNVQSIAPALHDGTNGINTAHNITRSPWRSHDYSGSGGGSDNSKKKIKSTPKGPLLFSAGINAATNYLSGLASDQLFGESELGRGMGTLFSSGISSVGNTIGDNLLKGAALTKGLGINAAASLAGAGAGLAANYMGQGITSLMGDSRLGRAVGQGFATGAGTIGGAALQGAITGTTSIINPYALGMQVLGSALGAATGPSKEYAGKYGGITQGLDIGYDTLALGANFIPGAGQLISGGMILNKGLSNIFGSTDGMTVQDAILGSAFMPAPVKWLNMAGASRTGSFNNQSWQNSEKVNSFMGNAFGNLGDRFDQAREEAGKTYGTFSQGAKREAQENIDYANYAWNRIMQMADQNRYQNIRSQDMSSINNQRYAQYIRGGFKRTALGKQGMKILNNATNHNIGMRLLSGAALIDNKQMILCNVPD